MTIKKLTAFALITAGLAGPAFAQEADRNTYAARSSHQRPAVALRNFRGTYNQVPANESVYGITQPRDGSGIDKFGSDRSRVGGHDADLNPPGT